MQQQAARITVIPAVIRRSSQGPMSAAQKKRVAAYARVSTDNEEQLTSYEAQVDYYTRYIKGKDEWEFVEVYNDEGISATSTKHRGGFKRMIQDALDGKIDLILTKSVSRFARNTVDTLTTVRQLKEKGIEIILREGKYLYIRQQGRATHNDHEFTCARGKPLHFRERHMGPAQAVCRREGQPPL